MQSAELVADHTLLLALPAFAPAVVVVGVVIWVAMRDRRKADDDDTADDDHAVDADTTEADDAEADAADEDGTP